MRQASCATCSRPIEAGHGRKFCSRACWPSSRPRWGAPADQEEAAPLRQGTYEEVIQLLWTAARRGSVSAMTTLRAELKSDPIAASSIVDELSKRRRKRR